MFFLPRGILLERKVRKEAKMKKIISLFLTVVLILTSVAFVMAESVEAKGSKSPSGDGGSSTSHSSSSSNDSGWQRPTTRRPKASVGVTVTDASDAVNDQIADMAAAVAAGDSPLSTLPEEVQVQMAELGDNVTANEACGIDVINFEDGCGATDVEFSFATKYTEDQKLLALVTCFDENKAIINQFVLPVTVTPEGKVIIHFTEDVLKAINDADSSSIVIFEKK